uniref:Uncharacterized protein AlNc14C23G2343 n=1 Tax=Albugo laibachii Nc14 TaxID=890382 RepID=F0W641_9STRA|nr:conserved hypothetical protein [Albugo laibachii Nc14]|eukprot:CCA16583.1 conserved hypothetical protein [Albugo laibachii Nc14]
MTDTMEHGVELPKLKLGTFVSHPKFLDSIDPPKYPFNSPAWTLQEKPRSILLLDVFKNNEMIGTYNVNQKAVYLIGRNTLICDIALNHCSISRLHATIIHHCEGCTYLVDLGSCHGTFVDEVPLQKLQPTLIVNGSILKFGASSRYYCYKTFDSREQIVEIVRQSTGLENDEMIVQQNTMLNRAISYRLGISPVRDDARSNDRAGSEDSRHSQSTSMAATKKSNMGVDPFRDTNGTHRTLSESDGKADVSVESRRSLSLAQSHSMTSHFGKCQLGTKVKRVHFCTDPPNVIPHSDSNFPKRKCTSTEDLSSLAIEGD